MKISIIIPTVGRSTLREVLFGLMNSQNFEKIAPEIIVVRDAVEGEFLVKQEKDFPKVKFLCTLEKAYAGGARNLGIEKSTGEVIAFLGDDTIPQKDWLERVSVFHSEKINKNDVLLGKVSWAPDLATDSFHHWLENNAQFAFKSIAKYGANWRHFYTSNISLKRELIGKERFSDKFIGWGFEDTEFGYRLFQKGMKISYDAKCEVLHDHEQQIEKVWEQTRNARQNAVVFESLHPEVHILPCPKKIAVLEIMIVLSYLIPTQKMKWWREWKKAWLNI